MKFFCCSRRGRCDEKVFFWLRASFISSPSPHSPSSRSDHRHLCFDGFSTIHERNQLTTSTLPIYSQAEAQNRSNAIGLPDVASMSLRLRHKNDLVRVRFFISRDLWWLRLLLLLATRSVWKPLSLHPCYKSFNLQFYPRQFSQTRHLCANKKPFSPIQSIAPSFAIRRLRDARKLNALWMGLLWRRRRIARRRRIMMTAEKQTKTENEQKSFWEANWSEKTFQTRTERNSFDYGR